MAEPRDQGPFDSSTPAHARPSPLWRFVRASPASALAASLGALLLACSGAAPNTTDRYPGQKRPETPISTSDGEVLGAHEQDPADTLDASLTNEHGAARSPHAEQPAEAAHERLEQEECVRADQAALRGDTAGADGRRRPLCPPSPAGPKD